MSAYLERQHADKTDRVVPDLRGEFGLDGAELADQFAFYTEAFSPERA